MLNERLLQFQQIKFVAATFTPRQFSHTCVAASLANAQLISECKRRHNIVRTLVIWIKAKVWIETVQENGTLQKAINAHPSKFSAQTPRSYDTHSVALHAFVGSTNWHLHCFLQACKNNPANRFLPRPFVPPVSLQISCL